MKYKLESISTNFGKGVRILKNEDVYEQISCDDGIYARIFKESYKEKDKTINTKDYHGIIFRPLFEDTEKDYEKFKTLTDRLQNISGEEIPNAKVKFMDYISHTGLEKELDAIDATVRINLKNKEGLPEKTLGWLNSKSHSGGFVSDIALYFGGFAIMLNSNIPPDNLPNALIAYGIVAPILEGVTGLMSMDSLFGWCGLLHAPSFFTSRIIHRKKLENPDYILDKFIKNYTKLEEMGNSVGNQKIFSKQSKFADRHLSVIEELFPFTEHQKGFSINYDSPNREDVVDLFNYILKGGNVPKISKKKGNKEKTAKSNTEKVNVKPVKTNFINPWEIEVPKIEGKKNG